MSPFPETFDEYDLDKNKRITLEELAQELNVKQSDKETKEAFNLADENGDGELNCSEFTTAPYIFEHSPSC